MKKLLFLLIASVLVMNVNAKLRYKSLNNFSGKTTVVLEDTNWKKGTSINDARFNDDGKTYEATSMMSVEKGDTMTLTMTFKKLTVFRKVSVCLRIDGKEVKIPIQLEQIAFKTHSSLQ